MILKKNNTLLTGVTAVILTVILVWWMADDHYPADLVMRVPGMDNRPKIEPRSENITVGEFFDSLGTFDELVPGEWPRFRGINFDNIVRDTFEMANRGILLSPWSEGDFRWAAGPAVKTAGFNSGL
jgi:hypothetical protein